MFKTVRNAFKVKDIRTKLFFTFVCLLVIRLGSAIPLYGVDGSYIAKWFENQTSLGFFDSLTGGSFSSMSIFALSITPYITASIIMQLLTIAIPKLEEMHKDGEEGRKKIASITRYLNAVLSIVESLAMAIGFGNQGYFKDGITATNVIVSVVALTAGSAFLMWIGEQITEKGIGNGISVVLLINIVSRIPQDFLTLYNTFVKGKGIASAVVAGAIVIAVVVFMVAFIIVLSDGERRIKVSHAKKMQGRKMVGGQSSFIPLKVNTAGVIPVIFASSLMSFPIIIASFMGIQPSSGAGASLGQKILKVCNQSAWFNITSWDEFKYTLGLLIYILLIVFFAYFYTSITFNPLEVSNNLKKQGGFIPGIRPGKPTTDYLTNVLNKIIFIGACGLTIVAVVPIICSGAFGADVSFGGTSLIIIVGVVLEAIKQVESMMLVRHYKGFIND